MTQSRFTVLMDEYAELDLPDHPRLVTPTGFAVLHEQYPWGLHDHPIYEPDMPDGEDADFPLQNLPWIVLRPVHLWDLKRVIVAGGYTYDDALSAYQEMLNLAVASGTFRVFAAALYTRAAESVAAKAKTLSEGLDDMSDEEIARLIEKTRKISDCA